MQNKLTDAKDDLQKAEQVGQDLKSRLFDKEREIDKLSSALCDVVSYPPLSCGCAL